MILTESILKKCMPHATEANIKLFTGPLNLTCDKYEINTNRRQAAFLAQIAHESNNLKDVRENLNYSVDGLCKVFSKYFTREQAEIYAHHPISIANRVYANRYGNGDEASGDGWKFRAGGLLGTTFKDNYEALSIALNYDFVKDDAAIEKPGAASLSAGWYWNLRDLNRLADIDAFEKISIKINGANKVPEQQDDGSVKMILRANGWEQRLIHWENCRKALNVTI